jgi:hypothetical protein
MTLPEQKGIPLTTNRQQRNTRNRQDAYSYLDSAKRPIREEDLDGADLGYDGQPGRLPTSSRRYDALDPQGNTTVYHKRPVQTIPPRRSATTQDVPVEATRPRRRIHWMAILGMGAVLALLIIIAAWFVNSWWIGVQEDWKYTSTFRTFSVDEAVGHNGDSQAHPSHFIVQNDKRRILIIELPADDETKAIIYQAPTLIGDGQDRQPVTISFQTDPQTGRLDMVLHIQDQQYTYTNNGTKFVQPAV